jgi:hypothetical protein
VGDQLTVSRGGRGQLRLFWESTSGMRAAVLGSFTRRWRFTGRHSLTVTRMCAVAERLLAGQHLRRGMAAGRCAAPSGLLRETVYRIGKVACV